jgi:hypothetical protein
VDKVLALRGGGEAVALWAQLASVVDLVAGIALAGIAGGLTVLVAQASDPERRRDLLRHALAIGLAVSIAPAIAVLAGAALLDTGMQPLTVAAAALAGCIVIIPGMLNSYWLGRERRDAQLALAAASALVAVTAVAWAPADRILEFLLVAQAAPASGGRGCGRSIPRRQRRCAAICCPESPSASSARCPCWPRAGSSPARFPGTTPACCRPSGG